MSKLTHAHKSRTTERKNMWNMDTNLPFCIFCRHVHKLIGLTITHTHTHIYIYKGKAKVHPSTDHEGP
jgi:hypothetical protein